LLAAQVSFGLQGDVPKQKLDLLKLTTRSMAHVRRQSWGDSLDMPAFAAEFFTTCQITFSVTPLPR
jgi:hypothetical protein